MLIQINRNVEFLINIPDSIRRSLAVLDSRAIQFKYPLNSSPGVATTAELIGPLCQVFALHELQ